MSLADGNLFFVFLGKASIVGRADCHSGALDRLFSQRTNGEKGATCRECSIAAVAASRYYARSMHETSLLRGIAR